jgi:hypothetical protein
LKTGAGERRTDDGDPIRDFWDWGIVGATSSLDPKKNIDP